MRTAEAHIQLCMLFEALALQRIMRPAAIRLSLEKNILKFLQAISELLKATPMLLLLQSFANANCFESTATSFGQHQRSAIKIGTLFHSFRSAASP